LDGALDIIHDIKDGVNGFVSGTLESCNHLEVEFINKEFDEEL
jgi:hypothetical protein